MPDSPSMSHFLWTQPETVWQELLRPWFAACARIGWERERSGDATTGDAANSSVAIRASAPVAPMLLAPDAGMIAWIKGRVVAEGIGCLGVHFHTPGTLRGLLAQAYGLQGRVALREDLHLLMGQAARSLPDNSVAQAAVLDPAALVRLCDRIDRAGWRSEGFSTAAARELATRYFDLLAEQDLRTVAQVERELLGRAQSDAVPACGSLLAVGFGCEHSESLLLLRAAALSARQPIFCLDTTGTGTAVATTPAALAWQASCEEYFGLAQPFSATAAGENVAEKDDLGAATALGAWATALAEHGSVEPSLRPALQSALRLLTFRTLDEEARHTVGLVRHWLTKQSDTRKALRIGIVLAGDGSLLGREIAAGLSAQGIAHYDSLGHQPARESGQRLLEGWCDWQSSNQLDDFNAFLAELCRQNLLFTGDLRHWERAADKALSQTLCAELGVIAACLGQGLAARSSLQAGSGQPDFSAQGISPSAQETVLPESSQTGTSAQRPILSQRAVPVSKQEIASPVQQPVLKQPHVSSSQRAVREILENWPQLPLQASFAEFWEQSEPVLARLGWPLRLEPLQERALSFGATLSASLPRSAFISWLRTVARVPGRTRNPLGHEPFAQVHLVTLAEAGRQRWSHLCVVGVVQGQWPPLEADSALLDPERCAELNRRAERPSRVGQGQFCIGGNHTFLGGARQRREAFDAAFLRLLGETGAGCILLSRYCAEPGGQNTEVFPSEYFLRSVYAATGSLDCGEMAQVDFQDGGHPGKVSDVPYPQVALAYLRRRDPSSGFDAYSYALSTPPAEPLRLSCSHWAEALARPAHAWYRYLMRVKKRLRASESDFRRQSQGIWVHQWLNPTAERRFGEAPVFVPRPDVTQWRLQVAERAEQLRRNTAAIYTRAGRQLPQWWQSDWSAALAIADAFAQTLGADTPADGFGAAQAQEQTANEDIGWNVVVGECPLAPLRLNLQGHPLDGVVLEGIVDLLLAPDLTANAVLETPACPPLPASAAQAALAGALCDSAETRPVAGGGESTTNAGGVTSGIKKSQSNKGSQNRKGSASPLWLVDYKTGSDGSLTLKSWEEKGAGLQLVLYSFALQARGASAVQMTLLRKETRLLPQLELAEISDSAPIWETLALPMREGVFGMRGALRDTHSFVGDYPIATLPVDPLVLERKARLSFTGR